MNPLVNEKDEITMKLVHYFVTEENYTPINVQGAQNEVWLENLEAPYKVIRINSKYIHNNEQLRQDLFKIGFVIKQIKKKTLSFKMKALNICLDMGSSVNLKEEENDKIKTINVTSLSDLKKNKEVKNNYPNIKKIKSKEGEDSLADIIHITCDINIINISFL